MNSMFRKLGALVVGLGTSVCLAGATHAVAQQGDFNSPDLVLINGKIPLLLRTLLIRPQAGGSHDPSFWAGGGGEGLEGSSSDQVVRQVLGGDAMKAAPPLLEPAVVGVDVVDV